MKSALRNLSAALLKTRRRKLLCLLALLGALPLVAGGVVLVFWTLPVFRGHLTSVLNPSAAEGLVYFHDYEPSVPWSMHVVKFSRKRKDLELVSLMGLGQRQGMATVSQQVSQVPPAWGRPVAAVNGDLYNDDREYFGDPEGLQIVRGELVSGPSPTRACLWVDSQGNPHHDDVRSQFQVTWPDGRTTAFGLNEARGDASAVLYTAAVGPSTRTHGGVELVLERSGTNAWLPLRLGQTLQARVREVKSGGNSATTADTLVLSLGPELAPPAAQLRPGASLRLSTATTPALAGIPTAIGGGPTLVAGGKAREWSGVRMRHPRTAIGWNQDYIYLVVVDGRQLRVSAGMTFPELADYLVRLGCEEAFGFDGGGSATCWANGAVRNSPSQGRERPAANVLAVVEKNRSQK
jgi:hypothetical protein